MNAGAARSLAELRAALERGAADGVLCFGAPRNRERVLSEVERAMRREAWEVDLSWLRHLRGRRAGKARRRRTDLASVVAETKPAG